MSEKSYSLPYPRKRLLRGVMRVAGRALFSVLARTTITGRENFPKKGPLILVGNHVAVIEAAMMAVLSPWQVELLGTGEIPLDPRYSWVIYNYGFIPIHRGDMDRDALKAALDVLKQDGVIGIFPEGGIWESKIKKARTGVAWLSYQSGAPVLPIGFGGVDGALGAAFKFKRPAVSMNVGKLMPAVTIPSVGQAKKDALQDAANAIMQQVADLIPAQDKARWNRISDEHFELELAVQRPDGSQIAIPTEHLPAQPAMLSKFFHRPIMLDVFTRNLGLPAQALQHLDSEHDPLALGAALDVVLHYLATENQQFISYRFGYDEAGGMLNGLQQLRAICAWAAEQDAGIYVTPIRHYQVRGNDAYITERKVGEKPLL